LQNPLGLRKGARLDGRREQKLQVRKIVLSACGTRDRFSLELTKQMLVAETLKLKMPLQDVPHDFQGFLYASFMETGEKGNRSDSRRWANSYLSKSQQIRGSFKNIIIV